MNILVTGANGQLGNEMRIVARESSHTFTFADIVPAESQETLLLDITDRESVDKIVAELGIDCIVNCAAYTNVEKAETDIEAARLLNAVAPGILGRAMAARGGLVVHISTDYVFGGDAYNTPCREDQTGKPTGVYGLTKLEGEEALIASGCDYAILRTAWLYSEYGKNFVKTMLALTGSKPTISVVFDQVGTPTYALDLARAIMAVLNAYAEGQQVTGIYHFSNEGVCSWYDFAVAIAKMAGHDKCDIKPCHSDEFPSAVVRPAYSVLDKTKIKQTFGLTIPYWTDSLRTCLGKLLVL